MLLLILNSKLDLYLQTRGYIFDGARTSDIFRLITDYIHIEIPIFESLAFKLFIQSAHNLSI